MAVCKIRKDILKKQRGILTKEGCWFYIGGFEVVEILDDNPDRFNVKVRHTMTGGVYHIDGDCLENDLKENID